MRVTAESSSRRRNHSIQSGALDITRTYGNPIGVFLSDALGFGLTLLEGVLILELGAHDD